MILFLPMINLFRTAEFGEKENQLNQSSPARANRNRFRCLLHCRFCQDQSWHPKKNGETGNITRQIQVLDVEN